MPDLTKLAVRLADLKAQVETLTAERDIARANARVLAHSYVHENRPPRRAVDESLAYPADPSRQIKPGVGPPSDQVMRGLQLLAHYAPSACAFPRSVSNDEHFDMAEARAWLHAALEARSEELAATILATLRKESP